MRKWDMPKWEMIQDIIDFSTKNNWISYQQIFELINHQVEGSILDYISLLITDFNKESNPRRKWIIACMIHEYDESANKFFDENRQYIKGSVSDYLLLEESDQHNDGIQASVNSNDELDAALDELDGLLEFDRRCGYNQVEENGDVDESA